MHFLTQLGRYKLPEGVRGLQDMGLWDLIRECMLYGVNVFRHVNQGTMIAAHYTMPTVQQRMRGCNKEIIHHRDVNKAQKPKTFEIKLREVEVGSSKMAFETGGMRSGMTYEHFSKQRRLIQTVCGYQPDMYPADIENWKGDDFFSGDAYQIDLGIVTQKEAVTFAADNNTIIFTDEVFNGIGGNGYSIQLDTAEKIPVRKQVKRAVKAKQNKP